MNEPTKTELTKRVFAIDAHVNNGAFEGYHIQDNHWNGWDVPLFTKEVMQSIIEQYTTKEYPIVFQADYVPSEDTNETTSIIRNSELTSPKGEKLFFTDGWCWEAID